jgi:hypothetical protein
MPRLFGVRSGAAREVARNLRSPRVRLQNLRAEAPLRTEKTSPQPF